MSLTREPNTDWPVREWEDTALEEWMTCAKEYARRLRAGETVNPNKLAQLLEHRAATLRSGAYAVLPTLKYERAKLAERTKAGIELGKEIATLKAERENVVGYTLWNENQNRVCGRYESFDEAEKELDDRDRAKGWKAVALVVRGGTDV